MDRTSDVDAISLDNIDVLSKWRVESEMPIMEEAPAWLKEEPEQQQALEEQQGEEEQEEEEEEQEVEWPEDIMEGDALASIRPDKQPIIFSRKRGRGWH
jgi:hypothetical protein